MAMIVKVAVVAAREDQQEQLDQELLDAGIVRVMSAIPPFRLTASDDVETLTAIAASYRSKPRIVDATDADLPDADDPEADTEELVALVHRVGYMFNWDAETRLWCVSGVRDGFPDDSPDEPARDRRQAAFEALRYLID